LTGELRQLSGISITNNTLNLVATPEFGALTEGLLSIARAHPEAKADIIALLRQLDEQPATPKPNGSGHHLMIEGQALQVGQGQ